MAFKRYDGVHNGAIQKKVDDELTKCPFCGESPHWLLDAHNGMIATATCMCEKCGGKLYFENRGFSWENNLQVVDVGTRNIRNLTLNATYHITSLQSVANEISASGNTTKTINTPIINSTTNGATTTSKSHKNILTFLGFVIIAFVVILLIALLLSSNNNDVPQTGQNQGVTSNATVGERNALRRARDYLSTMAFSKQGLISQLEFEGFSATEANYGANNCGANWNEQAKRKGAEYLRVMAFSRQGLIEQLEFDGFTHEQAVYGAEANGF